MKSNKINPVILLYSLCVLCVLFFLATLYQRGITLDDAWFAEQAYWFANNGYVRSDLFEGYPIFAGRILVYHKLHIWQGALAYKLFGWNVYVFKSIALFYTLLFVGIIFVFLKRQLDAKSMRVVFPLFVLLYFSNNLILTFGFEYRPDIMMMCVGFISFIFLYKVKTSPHHDIAVIAGIFAGITMLFHINGIIFILAGGILLSSNKNYKYLPAFLCGAALGFLPYFFEMHDAETLRQYVFALGHDPAVSDADKSLLGWLSKLVWEFKRYTIHTYETFYTLLFVMVVTYSWKTIRQHQLSWQMFLYWAWLSILMALITTGNKTVYLLYTLPYMTLLMAMYLLNLYEKIKLRVRISVVIALFMVTNMGRSHTIFSERNNGTELRNAKLVQKYEIQKGEAIFAPATFIFNEINNVRIQTFLPYLFNSESNHNELNALTFFKELSEKNKKLALLDNSVIDNLKFKPTINQIYSGYQYLGEEQGIYVFKPIMSVN